MTSTGTPPMRPRVIRHTAASFDDMERRADDVVWLRDRVEARRETA